MKLEGKVKGEGKKRERRRGRKRQEYFDKTRQIRKRGSEDREMNEGWVGVG